MRHRIFVAAMAVAFAVLLTTPAWADIVDLTDGENGFRKPKSSKIETKWGDVPSDRDLRESGKDNLELAYDRSKIGRHDFPSAQVVEFWVTRAFENESFNNGEQYGLRGYWVEAAAAFAQAASELEGTGKQLALYKRMIVVSQTGQDNATLSAANKLLASNPKTYYFGPAQERRARIYARRKKMGNALKALEAVTSAPGMNVRDYFSAKYLSVWLSKTVGADSMEKWQKAEKAYRELLRELEAHPRKQLAQVPRFRILMSLGESLRGVGKLDEARKVFDQILDEANDATDKGVLAGVYYGLGDAVFEEAKKLQAGSATPKEQIKALLDKAALHYLRVIYHYNEHAGLREMTGATEGAARVFRSLFTLSGEKDCVAGRRAYELYRKASEMQPQGEIKRILVSEGLALKARLDDVCK